MIFNFNNNAPEMNEVPRSTAVNVYGDPENLKPYKSYFMMSIDERQLIDDQKRMVAPAGNDVMIIGNRMFAMLKIAATSREGPHTRYELLVGEMVKEKFGGASFTVGENG